MSDNLGLEQLYDKLESIFERPFRVTLPLKNEVIQIGGLREIQVECGCPFVR